MAPAVVQAAAGAAAKDFKKESATARLLGSGKIRAMLDKERKLIRVKALPVLLSSPSFIRYSTILLRIVVDQLLKIIGRHDCETVDEQSGKGNSQRSIKSDYISVG